MVGSKGSQSLNMSTNVVLGLWGKGLMDGRPWDRPSSALDSSLTLRNFVSPQESVHRSL